MEKEPKLFMKFKTFTTCSFQARCSRFEAFKASHCRPCCLCVKSKEVNELRLRAT